MIMAENIENIGESSNLNSSVDTNEEAGLEAYPGLTIAVSSRALFDVEREHQDFTTTGMTYEAYIGMHKLKEGKPMQEGPAAPLIKLMQGLNRKHGKELFRIILVSCNSTTAGPRFQGAIEQFNLCDTIQRMCLCDSSDITDFLLGLKVDLLITRNSDDAARAIAKGVAAFTIETCQSVGPETDQIRVAFDLEALLNIPNLRNIDVLPSEGPLAAFGKKLGKIHRMFHGKIKYPIQKQEHKLPIRIFIDASRASSNIATKSIEAMRKLQLDESVIYYGNGDDNEDLLKLFNPHIQFLRVSAHVAEETTSTQGEAQNNSPSTD